MKCKCPEGYPQSVERGFGSEADSHADLAGIPQPRYGVTVHTGACPLSDAPHTIPQDYAHPHDEFDYRGRKA